MEDSRDTSADGDQKHAASAEEWAAGKQEQVAGTGQAVKRSEELEEQVRQLQRKEQANVGSPPQVTVEEALRRIQGGELMRIMVGDRATGRTTALCEWVLGGESARNGFGWSRIIVTPEHCRAWTVECLRRHAELSRFEAPGRAVATLANSLVVSAGSMALLGLGPVEYAVDNAEQVLTKALGTGAGVMTDAPAIITMFGAVEPTPLDRAKRLAARQDDDDRETEQMERSALDTVRQLQDAEDAARHLDDVVRSAKRLNAHFADMERQAAAMATAISELKFPNFEPVIVASQPERRDPGADWATIAAINAMLRSALKEGGCQLGNVRNDLVQLSALERRTRDDLKITIAVLAALPAAARAAQQYLPGDTKSVPALAREIGVVPAFLWRVLDGNHPIAGELQKLLTWLDAAMDAVDT